MQRNDNMNLFYLLKPKSTVEFVYKTNSVRQGLDKLRKSGFSAIPVIDESGEYIGTVSEGDFLWNILDESNAISSTPRSYGIIDIVNEERNRPVRSTATMNELLLRVMDQNFVPVIDDRNMFVGIVTRRDVLRYYYNREREAAAALD